MTLPKISQPIYELTLPSSKRKISYRPYLVKEDKILLMAAESDDPKEIASATRQVVNNCVLDKGFDCLNFPIFDVDFIFMNLRAKSVGNQIKQSYTCNNVVDGTVCNQAFDIMIDINEVQVIVPDNPKELRLNPSLVVTMKYPTYKTAMEIMDSDNELEQTIQTLYGSVESMSDKEQTYSMADTSYEEFKEFIDSLLPDQFDKLKNFVEKMPYFEIKKEHVCEKCGFVHKITVDDPISFF